MFINLIDDQASFEIIDERIKNLLKFKGTNLVLLFLAIMIASIGLNINSLPVIIGAMLISPLMGPILGIAYFLVRNDYKNTTISFINIMKFISISIIFSFLYFLISPIDTLTQEINNRLNPNIWDVLIAIFGGISGIIAITRKDFNNIFPGVAIATSLMPPLCTTGYCLSIQDFEMALNAFYLFLINSFFMCLATIIMLKIIHIPELHIKTNKKNFVLIFILTILIIIPSIFKGSDIIEKEIFQIKSEQLINNIKFNNIDIIAIDINKNNKKLNLILIENDALKNIVLDEFKQKYGLNIKILIANKEINLDELRKEVTDLNKDKLNKIKNDLYTELSSRNIYKHDNLKKELKILFHEINNVYIDDDNTILIQNYSNKFLNKRNKLKIKEFIHNKNEYIYFTILFI